MPVQFAAFRKFEAMRISTNDAMVALLIGSRVARFDLTQAAEGDADTEQKRLPELFPRVAGIERLNRTARDSIDLLEQSERHLAYMAIPFTLSVYGTLLVVALNMIKEDGHTLETDIADVSQIHLSDVHSVFAKSSGVSLPVRDLALFALARQIRNRIVHYAGTTGSHIQSGYRQLSEEARQEWERLAGRPLRKTDSGAPLDLAAGELIAVLGVTKHLADEINLALIDALSREYWARLVVEDFAAVSPQRFRDSSGFRRVVGFGRTYYSQLGLAGDELEAAYEAVLRNKRGL